MGGLNQITIYIITSNLLNKIAYVNILFNKEIIYFSIY